MKYSLRFKLITAFLLITVISFSLIGILANVILTNQFQAYVIKNLNQKNEELVATLEDRYSDWGGKWELTGLENIGVNALSDGLIIRLSDQNGKVIWDAMEHNHGVCVEMLETMAANMKSFSAGFDGGYTEKSYQLISGADTIGNVTIGYYGPYFYTDTDIEYLRTLNKLLIVATIIAGVIALVLGTYTANRMSKPITRVIKAAEEIAEGNFDEEVTEKSTTSEIIELTSAINALAVRLGKQENLRKRLTADVAHELRTPIANLQGHLEAMIDGIWPADAERLQSCHEETIRLSKIVSDLEKLSHYESENMTLHRESFSLTEMIKKTLKSFENDLRNKNISIVTNDKQQVLIADQDKMTQVMVNIFSNAIKYTPEGGHIEIMADEDENNIMITVKDSGIGISEEDLPFIFQRFYRADQSRSRITGGAGIGLAIVKSLVEAHGGKITVKSKLGVGSEFVISIPKEMK